MNDPVLRHILELLILFPSILFALRPLQAHFRYKKSSVYGLATAALLLFSAAGGYLSALFGLSSAVFVFPSLPLLFLLYVLTTSDSVSLIKKTFCFLNGCMLGSFCVLYTRYLSAPWEIGLDRQPFTIRSSLLTLLFTFLLGLAFWRTLSRKLPALLDNSHIDRIWPVQIIVALVANLLILYSYPLHAEVVMAGRVRPVMLLVLPLFPAAVLYHYHNLWWIATQISEKESLRLNNNLLEMERKRYEDLEAYIDETRIMHHDFRHHMLVIGRYAKEQDHEALLEYVQKLERLAESDFTQYCPNNAISAIASHYNAQAKAAGCQIRWSLALPASLPFADADLCALLGNLVENAIHAVKDLPEESRQITVTSSMLSESMLGLSIENPYAGEIQLLNDGLPGSLLHGHGTGMHSASAIVSRYNGSIRIDTEEQVFSVQILLMAPSALP
ncbi:MAG: sensor histidine kinase [Blautia sp.]|nr:sensor histidine kinase [Blautia sp.]